MIDIHSHILPGIDDGSPDVETSIKMAKIAVEEGITEMVATPHFIPNDKEIDKELILEKVKELNQIFTRNNINLTLYPGEEIFLSLDIPKLLDEGRILTLFDQKKYMLIELPMMSLPSYTMEVLWAVKLRNITPIIAHPERNREIINDVSKLREFIRIGALIQVNSLSLMGVFGSEVKKTAEKIIKKKYAQFIATDCHTPRARSPRINKAVKDLPQMLTKTLTMENPLKVKNNEEIKVELKDYTDKKMGILKRLSVFLNSLKEARVEE
ncbi:tyrosine-protein phosphatase [Thermovenabulum sp.]|uniref:tyrosine-protein phosphatase n=1 Tax=Thermovenabulum sp. TaxID=3100335 RepID=UPI003C798ED7